MQVLIKENDRAPSRIVPPGYNVISAEETPSSVLFDN